MCKEDVRIGRKKTFRFVGAYTASALRTIIGAINPNRACYTLALDTTVDPAARTPAVLVSLPNPANQFFAMLTPYVPWLVIDVETFGDLALGQLAIQMSGDVEPGVTLWEATWLEELKDL